MSISFSGRPLLELSSSVVAAFGRAAVAKIYPPASCLCVQGERPERVLFVERGFCKLVWRDQSGRQAILGLRPQGWPIGLAAALSPNRLTFAVEAGTSCRTREIPAHVFLDHLRHDDALMRSVLAIHAWELQEARTMQLLGLASIPARVRVQMALSWLSQIRIGVRHDADARPLMGQLRQHEMAELLAMAPETLSRVLTQLESEAVIRRRNGRIHLSGASPKETDLTALAVV